MKGNTGNLKEAPARKKDGANTIGEASVRRHGFIEIMIRLVRAITVPAVLVSVLLLLLYASHDDIFASLSQLLHSLLFLVLIPLLAYPLSLAVPRLRRQGREGQRKLAFALNLLGYIGAVAYGFAAHVSQGLFLIFLTYLISVLILMLFNNVIRIHASGHACGTMGPLVFLVYFVGPYGIAPCVLIAAAVVWSSLRLGRHTIKELVLGALSALLAFGFAFLLACLAMPVG